MGSSAFDRHYSRNHCYFLFLRVLRCFSSPRSPRSSCGGTPAGAGFPHSDIAGSMRICRSPTLFAACRVLLRYREPRHPSCALLSFSLFFRLNARSWASTGRLFTSASPGSGALRRLHRLRGLPRGLRSVVIRVYSFKLPPRFFCASASPLGDRPARAALVLVFQSCQCPYAVLRRWRITDSNR